MNKLKSLSLIVILTLVLSMAPVMAEESRPLSLPDMTDTWYIVEFDAPALAIYAKSAGSRLGALTADGRLDIQALGSQRYIDHLKADQARFHAELARVIPEAVVAYDYQIVLNAVAVKLPDSNLKTLAAIKEMQGVKRVSPQRIYTAEMDYSLPLINAPEVWSQVGGRDNAGAGIKVAIIDSGIDPDHALFDGTGWSYPAEGTWPKGYCMVDATFCNGKIISTHYYTPTLVVNDAEVNTPQDIHGHGTHVGGTAVGNVVTATYGTGETAISGVTPGAWIMAYKGLFQNTAGTSSTGSNIMLAAAIEDAITEGADIVSCSWGSAEWEYDDPLTAAYEAAVDAGIVVVFSTGNSGPAHNTTGSPTSPKFIEVGASTTVRAYYNQLSVTAPEPVTGILQNFAATEMSDIDPSVIPTTAIGPLPYLPTGLTGELLTEVTETVGSLIVPTVTVGITETAPYVDGWIAVIPRGTSSFSDKVANARVHGAVAAVIYLPPGSAYSDDDWKGGFTLNGEALYTVITGKEWGGGLVEWWKDHGDAARLRIGYPISPFESEVEDVIADFSSRGPNLRLAICPDLVAPGVNILSGNPVGGYYTKGGTSQAAPHVAGAAALLLSQHSEWTPAQVKSALMSTASQTILDLDQATVANGMTQGSGRLDVNAAMQPGVTFDKPSHSFGMVEKGTTVETVITAMSVSEGEETYSVSVQESITDTGHVTVTVSPTSLVIPPQDNGTLNHVFTITVQTDAGAMSQDIEGNIVLSGTTHMAHIPYWVRVTPVTTNSVLLIDDDLSGLGNADYRMYYTQALDELGVGYDVWDTTALGAAPGFPTRDVLDRYDTLAYFSGDDAGFFLYSNYFGWASGTTNELQAFLTAGGKMIAFGQDFASAMTHPLVGAPFAAFFGSNYSADNIFGGAIPRPAATGVVPFLDGKEIDFSTGGDGAGNMFTVDSLTVTMASDVSNIPLFGVPSTFTFLGGGLLGSAMSSDPTLERVADPMSNWFKLAHRTTFCSFGLEAVNNNTGYYTRTALLGDMFDYVNDELSVSLGASSYASDGLNVDFTAMMNSSVEGSAIRYRWDFGDGSVYTTTTGNTVSYQYPDYGVYQARVEVTDEYMHTAVSEPALVRVEVNIYLPLIMRNHPAP